MSLILRTAEVDATRPGQRWRWILTDEQGRELADHLVDLDAESDEFEAFCDLAGFVRRTRDPLAPAGSELDIMARIGRWLGEAVFGPAIGRELTCRMPCTVEVRPHLDSMFLLDRPLELTHLAGKPLSELGITLVLAVDEHGGNRVEKKQFGECLRILALFSMPSQTSVLAQRSERSGLSRLAREVGGRGHTVELRVLQYGVTRKVLADALADGTGWDILHLSSHGTPGGLVLELADGSPDWVSTVELVQLLHPARRRLKLALVSACHSGAATVEETLRWLQLDEHADAINPSGDNVSQEVRAVGVARGLVAGLDTAVVAMRYPVLDDFAIAFTNCLYRRLLLLGEPLDIAFREAVLTSCGDASSTGRRPLSAVTPALFGTRAAGLRLAPRVPDDGNNDIEIDPTRVPLPEVDRFVGRVQLLITASHALARDSPHSGVLFTGMAGAGKTACATEIAHQHVEMFDTLAWWQPPGPGAGGALETLADAFERQLGIQMIGIAGSESEFSALVDRLHTFLREKACLLVLDNLDTLLNDTGAFIDPQIESLLIVACTHGGKSRVVLTSRRTPASLPKSVLACHTHALSLAESALLARELPNLGRLLDPQADPRRPAAEVAAGRQLVRRVLNVVQGHPKLLELADAAAANPDELRRRLDNAAESIDKGGASLHAFFTTGTSELNDLSFLSVLHAWTETVLADLPSEARILANLIACMDDSDRQSGLVELIWQGYWDQAEREPVWPITDAVDVLVNGSLVKKKLMTPAESRFMNAVDMSDITDLYQARNNNRTPIFLYEVHPVVAEVAHATTDDEDRRFVNEACGSFWLSVAVEAAAIEGRDVSMAADAHEWASVAAFRYLIRCGRLRDAGRALSIAATRDRPPAAMHRILRQLHQIATAETNPEERLGALRSYGFALARLGDSGGIETLRAVLAEARGRDLIGLAVAVANDLLDTLARNSSIEQALAVSQELIELQHQAEVGASAVALSRGQQLRLLVRIGRDKEALAGAQQLLAVLPKTPTPCEEKLDVNPWLARELALEVAADAAISLGHWQDALDFNQQLQESMHRRGDDGFGRARARFNSTGPLMRLGRLGEAEKVLLHCQQVFEKRSDIIFLGLTFNRRALLETARGRHRLAIEFQQRALRYLYRRPSEVRYIASCHVGMAKCLNLPGDNQSIYHRFAAALLLRAVGDDDDFTALLAPTGGEYDMAFILEGLIAHNVETTPGVRFRGLLKSVATEPSERARLLRLIMAQTVIDTLRAMFHRGRLDEGFLSGLACTREWKPLVAALRRISNGEIDRFILADLDDINAGIIREVFRR